MALVNKSCILEDCLISKIVSMQVERGMLDGYCSFVRKSNLQRESQIKIMLVVGRTSGSPGGLAVLARKSQLLCYSKFKKLNNSED